MDAPKYSHESLHKARDIFEPETDVLLLTDIRQGFWHGLTHVDSREYQGCQLGGRYFLWRCTPMGCSTSSYSFQSMQWILAKKFRRLGIRLVNYSDDYAFVCKRHEAAILGEYLQREFEAHGLELNLEKSDFIGCRKAVVLGVLINLDSGKFEIPEKKKIKIVRGIKDLLAANRRGGGVNIAYVSARLLAKTVGRIMALMTVCGNAVRRMTRRSYNLITAATGGLVGASRRELKVAWDLKLKLSAAAVEELKFWRKVIPAHTGSFIIQKGVTPTVRLSSDAGEDGWCAILDFGRGVRHVARSSFTGHILGSSSTLRELYGLKEALVSFRGMMDGRSIVVYGDNQSAAHILEIGSNRPDLQIVAQQIFAEAAAQNVVILPRWLRRCHLQEEDDGSKFTDLTDFRLGDAAFETVQRAMHGPAYTHDRFSSDVNKRTGQYFNSRFYCPGSSGVDAFTQDWGGDTDNWLHPPWNLVGRAVRHLHDCKGKGTILFPWDTRQPWWHLVAPGSTGTVWRAGQPVRVELQPSVGLLTTCTGADHPTRRPLMAVRLDFTKCGSTRPTVPGMLRRLIKATAERGLGV